MTLVTWTRLPPSWAAMLPQKFSAATTWIWAEAAMAARSVIMVAESSDNRYHSASEHLGRIHHRRAAADGPPQQRRPPGSDRAPRPATVLPHRAEIGRASCRE